MSKDQEEHQSCCWLVQELREMEPSQNILALRGGAEEQPWAADTPPCSLQHLLRTALHSPPLSSTLQLTLTHASCTCLALVFYLPYLLLTPLPLITLLCGSLLLPVTLSRADLHLGVRACRQTYAALPLRFLCVWEETRGEKGGREEGLFNVY